MECVDEKFLKSKKKIPFFFNRGIPSVETDSNYPQSPEKAALPDSRQEFKEYIICLKKINITGFAFKIPHIILAIKRL